MKRACLFLAALSLASATVAAEARVKIPGEGWSIAFDAPALANAEESKREGGFAFRANSDRFNLSLFVEKPGGAGTSHQDCYRYYWPQARRNPRIDQDTVTVSETPMYVRVQFDIVATLQGQPVRDRNVDYYFAYRGKWVDVHISMVAPEEADAAVFAAFDESLDYLPDAEGARGGPSAPAAGAAPEGKRVPTAMELLREGSASYLQHDYAKAIEPYRQALELEKQNRKLPQELWRVLIDNLGMAYGITGDLKRSRETFELGISQDGRYPMFYYNLACTFAEMDDLDGAIANLKMAFHNKAHQSQGEHMPDPRRDGSFQRYLRNERFLAALREIEQ